MSVWEALEGKRMYHVISAATKRNSVRLMSCERRRGPGSGTGVVIHDYLKCSTEQQEKLASRPRIVESVAKGLPSF